MNLKIRRKSNFTIHIQLKEQIKGLVLNDELKNGMQLPTVRQLGEFLQINKNTVSKVYKELEEEGYLYSAKGKGTFVTKTEKTKDTKEFLKIVDSMLKKGSEFGLTLDEMWGIVYSKSQHFQMLEAEKTRREIGFIECNSGSIKDFEKIIKSEIKDLKVNSILIENLEKNIDKLKDVEIIVVPFIHYEEVRERIEQLNKEVLVIGTNQSLKILTYTTKFKNKKVGIIGYSREDEVAIARQFKNLKIKEFKYYDGVKSNGVDKVKTFLDDLDAVVVCTSVVEKVLEVNDLNLPHFIFKGKYDIRDLKILRELYN